jgi:hypothetical protein
MTPTPLNSAGVPALKAILIWREPVPAEAENFPLPGTIVKFMLFATGATVPPSVHRLPINWIWMMLLPLVRVIMPSAGEHSEGESPVVVEASLFEVMVAVRFALPMAVAMTVPVTVSHPQSPEDALHVWWGQAPPAKAELALTDLIVNGTVGLTAAALPMTLWFVDSAVAESSPKAGAQRPNGKITRLASIAQNNILEAEEGIVVSSPDQRLRGMHHEEEIKPRQRCKGRIERDGIGFESGRERGWRLIQGR